MRIFASCHECMNANHERALAPEHHWLDVGELTDDGFGRGKCQRGHSVSVVVQTPRYALLFDSACLALMDGYYREAIGSFAAALERFEEFAVRVMCRHRQLAEDQIDATWKLIGGRSEAQGGAFVLVYALHVGKAPQKWQHTELRNDVVHKGKLPTSEDAMAFGDAAYERILDVTDELMRSAPEALDKEGVMQFIRRANANRRPGENSATAASFTSPVSPEALKDPRPSFEEALQRFASFPMWVHPADTLRARAIAGAAGVDWTDFFDALRTGYLVPHIQQAVSEMRASLVVEATQKEQ